MPTAALLIIGDEILSGRTQDKNIAALAQFLTVRGIDLHEVRVVGDERGAIIEALNAMRARVDCLFTTGGIGPTHDDITADCVAEAFAVSLQVREEAVSMMKARYPELEMNEARLRMARIPDGASLIANTVSGAPGFVLGNVYVMAGVPRIMQAMLEALDPVLPKGVPFITQSIAACDLKEGDYAAELRTIVDAHKDVVIGSYPHMTDNGTVNTLVLRGRDENTLAKASHDVKSMLARLHGSEKGQNT